MSEPTIADLARSMEALLLRLDRRDCPFTDEEIEQIKRGAQIVEFFDTAGWIGKRLLALMAAMLAIISWWSEIKAFFTGGGGQ